MKIPRARYWGCSKISPLHEWCGRVGMWVCLWVRGGVSEWVMSRWVGKYVG